MEPVENFTRIDKELDYRISQLSLRPNKKVNKSGTFIIENEGVEQEQLPDQKKKHPATTTDANFALTARHYNPNNYGNTSLTPCKAQKHEQVNNKENIYKNTLSDEDELEDYLTKETQSRIMSLKIKNDYLSQVLAGSEKKLKQLIIDCNEGKKQLKEANKESIASQKIIVSLRELVAKKEAELKESKENVADKSRQCLELQKNMSSIEKAAKEDQKKMLACQTQNNRLKQQLEAAKTKIQTLSTENKGDKEAYSSKLARTEKKCQELQKEIKSLTCLLKKQDELNIVLQQQKNNIAAAKAAMCLEDQFLSLIGPFEEGKG